jgi:Ni,Fe-hydrogenase I small subunit
MFRFTRKLSSGSHSKYLAKITHLVQCGYIEFVQTLSVLWLHSMTCEACVLYAIRSHSAQHTRLTGHTMQS